MKSSPSNSPSLPLASSGRISRRAFLRGTGVSLALPFLDAMWPQRLLAADTTTPKRLVAVCTSLGIYGPVLYPKEVGREYTPTPYLDILKDLRNDLCVISGCSY